MNQVLVLFLLVNISLCPMAYAQECFLVKEKSKVLKSEGDCKTQHTPQSTFKIALSLMGYDAKVLTTAREPSWPLTSEYSANINVCKGQHDPRTWMRDSCVWYSQVLTKKLGLEKFGAYVTQFRYGNQNISGDPGKNNGLTKSWLGSSLKISPEEQTEFLQRLLDQNLSVSQKAYDNTKDILFIQELSGGWKLYGKTGNGFYKDKLQHGWFVGWIEKGPRKIVFAHHITDETPKEIYASFRSRNEVITKLWYIIDELEK